MTTQIRIGVFETNSSSTHSLVVCTREEYDKWNSGELYYLEDTWGLPDTLKQEFENRGFITEEEKILLEQNNIDEYSIKSFGEWGHAYEQGTTTYKTKSGEELVIRSYFGYDG